MMFVGKNCVLMVEELVFLAELKVTLVHYSKCRSKLYLRRMHLHLLN